MDTEMPRLDKTRLTVSPLDEFMEEKQYWLSRGKADRLNAIEINRRIKQLLEIVERYNLRMEEKQ